MRLALFEHPGLKRQLPDHGNALARRQVTDTGEITRLFKRRLANRIVGPIHRRNYIFFISIMTFPVVEREARARWASGSSAKSKRGPVTGRMRPDFQRSKRASARSEEHTSELQSL